MSDHALIDARARGTDKEAPLEAGELPPGATAGGLARPAERITGIHPLVICLALAGAGAFLAAVWLTFAGDREISEALVVVTGFSVMFFGLMTLTVVRAARDARWREPQATFDDFLGREVQVNTGRERGRDVLAEILLLPVALAIAMAAIGVVWWVLR